MKIKKVTVIFIVCMILISKIAYGIDTGMYNNLNADGSLSNIGNAILGIIRGIAGTAAVVSAIVLGIKYMYSAPGDKAEVKKRMMPFVIGSILAFGSLTLVDMVYDISKGLF